jgi:hypothetical protein
MSAMTTGSERMGSDVSRKSELDTIYNAEAAREPSPTRTETRSSSGRHDRLSGSRQVE